MDVSEAEKKGERAKGWEVKGVRRGKSRKGKGVRKERGEEGDRGRKGRLGECCLRVKGEEKRR